MDQSSNAIVITTIGPGEGPSLAELKTALRKKIPASVPISLVEDSGRTTDL